MSEFHVCGVPVQPGKGLITVGRYGGGHDHWRWYIEYWKLAMLSVILPASRIRFRKRTLLGHCPKCRYDLRATPDHCPECGHVPLRVPEKTDLNTKRTKQTKEE